LKTRTKLQPTKKSNATHTFWYINWSFNSNKLINPIEKLNSIQSLRDYLWPQDIDLFTKKLLLSHFSPNHEDGSWHFCFMKHLWKCDWYIKLYRLCGCHSCIRGSFSIFSFYYQSKKIYFETSNYYLTKRVFLMLATGEIWLLGISFFVYMYTELKIFSCL